MACIFIYKSFFIKTNFIGSSEINVNYKYVLKLKLNLNFKQLYLFQLAFALTFLKVIFKYEF